MLAPSPLLIFLEQNLTKKKFDEIEDWDFQKELLDYCRDDVNVSRLSWLALWKAMHEITGGLHIGIENCMTASFTRLENYHPS